MLVFHEGGTLKEFHLDLECDECIGTPWGHFIHETEGPWPFNVKTIIGKKYAEIVEVHLTLEGEGLRVQRNNNVWKVYMDSYMAYMCMHGEVDQTSTMVTKTIFYWVKGLKVGAKCFSFNRTFILMMTSIVVLNTQCWISSWDLQNLSLNLMLKNTWLIIVLHVGFITLKFLKLDFVLFHIP